MAGEERDARLILRAEDRASRTFEQVAKSVREVRTEIQQQAKEAERGVGSLDSYNRVLRNMKDLGDDLIGQQALIKRFETISERVGTAEARLEKANKALDEFNRKSAAGETVPKSLANAPERVQAATAALEKQQRELGLVTDRMQAAGISADNLDGQYSQIAASAREAAAGIAQAKTNLDGYEDVARRAAAANEALQKSQRFESAAAASPLPIEQLVYISQFDDALDRLKQSEAELAAQNGLVQKAAEAARLRDAAQYVKFWETSLEQAAQAERDLASLSAFRAVGADAAAAAADVSRFGATVDDSESKVQGLANTVRSALGGSNASIQNLETAIENVDRALATATAKSTKVNELQESAGKLAIAQATLVRTAEKVDAFRAQEQAVAASEARFTSAQREVERLAAAMAAADTPTEALTQDMTRARDAMERAGLAMQKERDQAARLSLALKQAGVDTANLDRVQDQLVASSVRAGQAQTQLTGKLKGKGGFLGLNPFELQILSYQINDVVTGLASGQPPLQILTQQGGQLAQIFGGRLLPILTRFGPIIAAIGVAVAFVASAIGRATDHVEALKTAERVMIMVGDSGRYTRDGLRDAILGFQELGISAENAQALVSRFAQDGLDPKYFDDYATAAVNLATVTGKEVPEAAQMMTDAFAKGKDGILELDDQIHFLTDAQRTQIKGMDGQKQSADIASIAFDQLYGRTQDLANQMNGPSQEATNNLSNAWNQLLDTIGIGSPWETVKGLINSVKNALADLLNSISDVIDGLNRLGARWEALRKKGGIGAVFNDIYENGLFGGEVTNARNARLRNQANTNPTTRDRTSTGGPTIRRRTSGGGGGRSRRRGGRRGRSAEQMARRVEQMEDQLDNFLAQMEQRLDRAVGQTLEQRLNAVDRQYKRIFEQIAEFKRLGGTEVDGVPIAEYEARVRLNQQLLRDQETMKYYEEGIARLERERTERIREITEAQERGDINRQIALERAQAVNTDIDTRVSHMASEALRFGHNLASARPSPKAERFIDKMLNASESVDNGEAQTQFLQGQVADQEKAINDIIRERNDLVAATNNLVELGVISQEEGQRRIQAAYEASNPMLQQQVDMMKQLLEVLLAANPAMQMFYDTWMAKLQGIQAQMQYVNPEFTKMKNQVDNLITQNAVAGIDKIAQALGSAVAGAQSFGDAVEQIGLAFANFILDTIAMIAKLIIQAFILKAVDSVTGGFISAIFAIQSGGGGGGGGGLFGGLFGILGGIFHEGGIAGSAVYSRSVPAAIFAGAPRYHGGGIAGLAPDEVPAILQQGEEIIKRNDPRHRFNGGGQSAPPPTVRQVLTFSEDELAGAMAGTAGEKVVITHIRRNAATLKQVLG